MDTTPEALMRRLFQTATRQAAAAGQSPGHGLAQAAQALRQATGLDVRPQLVELGVLSDSERLLLEAELAAVGWQPAPAAEAAQRIWQALGAALGLPALVTAELWACRQLLSASGRATLEQALAQVPAADPLSTVHRAVSPAWLAAYLAHLQAWGVLPAAVATRLLQRHVEPQRRSATQWHFSQGADYE